VSTRLRGLDGQGGCAWRLAIGKILLRKDPGALRICSGSEIKLRAVVCERQRITTQQQLIACSGFCNLVAATL
jgi:hypothetical protein